ncbi:MAG TPA: LuxR C-terminal-related transcriptional regulator [Thermoanaerobaculia bacterium]|nr:LuxR C-terminal-related transcriptional regulator [Thermoanaerobaculia bacterium]
MRGGQRLEPSICSGVRYHSNTQVNIERFSDLVQGIHRAALEPDRWPEAMRSISDALGATISGLVLRDLATGTFPFGALDPRSPAAALDAYRDYYGAIDVLAAEAARKPEGEVLTHEELMVHPNLRRSEVWNDFYVRWKFDHLIGAYALNDDRYTASLVVYRDAGPHEFSAEDYRTMALIVPHVTTALRCWLRLREAEHRTAGMAAALDSLLTGIILLDRTRRVVWMNLHAHEIVARRDGLALQDGHLVGASQSQTNALRSILFSIESPNRHATLARPSGSPPLLVTALGACGDNFPGSTAEYMLLISDGSQAGHGMNDYLQQVWKLTKAEAAVACAIADGKSLQEVSDATLVSVETLRSHLKRIFQKAGAHSQSDLVRLILATPAAMLHRGSTAKM